MKPGPAKGADGQELRTLLASRIGAMAVPTGPDEGRVMELLENGAAEQKLPIWTWTVTNGLAARGGSGQTNTANPAGALAFIRDQNRPGVFVFLDAQPLLDDAVAARLLKELAMARMRGRTIVLTGLTGELPPALEGVVVRWTPGLPDREELRRLARATAIGLANSGLQIALTRSQGDALVDSLLGLNRAQAERLIVQHTVADGRLDAADIPAIRAAKAELLSADSPLDLVPAEADLDSVGGLTTLKQWLRQRGRGFEPAAREFGLPAPRGVLLTGVPGTGKSLIAKAIAGTWGMALIALDTGRLHGSYVGQSEANIDQALQAVQTMSPSVLWIDEIEKIFGTSGDSDGGAANRVLGVLLRWMQERPDGVFVVATSNDITKLPPELTRKGRLDEVFFVDLPDHEQREAILQAVLVGKQRDPAGFELPRIAAATDGFSGAELAELVVSAMYRAYCEGQSVATEHVLAEAEQTEPLSVIRAEDVAAMRRWAQGRAVRA